MKQGKLQKFFKLFSLFYIFYIVLQICIYVFYMPKVFIDDVYYKFTLLNNQFFTYSFQGIYILIMLSLAIGLYNFKEVARRLLVFRYYIMLAFVLLERLLAFILYDNLYTYNLVYIIPFIWLMIEATVISLILNNKKIKSLFLPIKISKQKIILTFILMMFVFIFLGFIGLDKGLKHYKGLIAYNIAYSYYYKQDYKNALANFLNSITLGSKKRIVDANYKIGNCYYHLEDYNKARNYYQKVLGYNDKYVNAYIAIADTYAMTKDIEKLINYLNKALEIEPNNTEARERLDYVEEVEKEYEDSKIHNK